MSKERLTVTIDSELLKAANRAVSEKRVASLSGWVNRALAERAAKEQRLRALADAAAQYESEFGQISAAELLVQERSDRQNAFVIRSRTRAR